MAGLFCFRARDSTFGHLHLRSLDKCSSIVDKGTGAGVLLCGSAFQTLVQALGGASAGNLLPAWRAKRDSAIESSTFQPHSCVNKLRAKRKHSYKTSTPSGTEGLSKPTTGKALSDSTKRACSCNTPQKRSKESDANDVGEPAAAIQSSKFDARRSSVRVPSLQSSSRHLACRPNGAAGARHGKRPVYCTLTSEGERVR